MIKYKVLFLCVENAGRSQMAEAFAKELGSDIIEPISAGSNPAKEVNPLVKQVMEEIGISMEGKKPKGFEAVTGKIDFLVNMGCRDECPYYPSREVINWDIPDPKNKSIDEIREIRDLIKEHVRKLIHYIRSLS